MKTIKCLLLITVLFVPSIVSAQIKGWSCLINNIGDTLKLNGEVTSLIKCPDDNFYFAGNFQNSKNDQYVNKWDGNTWEVVDSNTTTLQTYSIISELCTDRNSNLYAATAFDGNGKWHVTKWDGIHWQTLGTGANALNAYYSIYAICTDTQNNVYASSSTNTTSFPVVNKWDGTQWTKIAPDTIINDKILALCSDNNGNVYAAGWCGNAAIKNYVAKWDGNSWSIIGTGANALFANGVIYSLACDKNGNIYAGGAFTNANGNRYVAKWDGSNWTELGAGTNALSANNDILTIYIDSTGFVYAGGKFTTGAPMGRAYVAMWDGTKWSEVGSGQFPLNTNNSQTSKIQSIAKDKDGYLYAGGQFYQFGNNGLSFIARYGNMPPLDITRLTKTDNIEIYPNPGVNEISVKIANDLLNQPYYIYSTNGLLIKNGYLESTVTIIDASLLPPSTYLLQIGTEKKHILKLRKN